MLLILFMAVGAQGAIPELLRQGSYNNTFPFPYPQYPQGFPQPPSLPQYPEGFPQPPPFPGQGQIPYFPQPGQPAQPQPTPQQQRDTPLEVTTETVPILKLDIQPNLGDGSYHYSYETGNGIKAEERGSQKSFGDPSEPQSGTVAAGSYSYTDKDGSLVQVTYTADENGFVAHGSHLPTEPPVPQEILAALERNAAEEAAQNGGVISPVYHRFFRTGHFRTGHR